MRKLHATPRVSPLRVGHATARRGALRHPEADVTDRESNTQPVRAYTEWDPLDEVIVGRLSGAAFPAWQHSMSATLPKTSWKLFQEHGGSPLPAAEVSAAEEELDALVHLLEARGIAVTRPEPTDCSAGFSTPDWRVSGGFHLGMPRDILMVLGDTIVEAPLSWRCRQHDIDAYRPLIKSYFQRGADWLCAPRPQLTPELFRSGFDAESNDGYAITEFEPVFDAADFLRFGHDLIVQKSHVTNEFGINWLRRALRGRFDIHHVEVNDRHAMHIDATMAPLAPGRLLVNPERYLPNDLFHDWEILKAPKPTLPPDWPMYFSSPWVSMNVLSLDERTVLVEHHEEPLIEALASWGFECITTPFRHVYTFGGSFHCVTVDVRRRGDPGRYLHSPRSDRGHRRP